MSRYVAGTRQLKWIVGFGLSSAVALSSLAAIAVEHDPAIATVAMMPGKIVSQGKIGRADGPMKLTGWRIEEIALPQVTKVTVNGKQTDVAKAWRVSVIGGPFQVRAMPAIVWIGDKAIGVGQENPNLTEISAITFDPEVLKGGAALSLSWGEHGTKYTLKERLVAPNTKR